MKQKSKFFLVLSSILLIFSTASCSRGWLRSKIQERFQKKMEEKPALIASNDLSQKIESPGDYTFTFPFDGIPRYYKVCSKIIFT